MAWPVKPLLTDEDIFAQPGKWFTVNGRNEYRFVEPDEALNALVEIEILVRQQRREWSRLKLASYWKRAEIINQNKGHNVVTTT